MKELNLKLNINELNVILEALGHQSYLKVYELIDKVQSQAKAQLNGSAGAGSLTTEDNYKEVITAAELTSN